ncbi:MAG: tetratricopeptide repeat protein [Mariniblastus sp.]
MQQLHERAQLLIQQSRYDLAEQEVGRILAENPDDAIGHLLLSICYKNTKRYREATVEAQKAIQIEPDNSRCHLILSTVYSLRNRFEEAERSAREALRLDPYDEDIYAELSKIQLSQKKWTEAIEFAESGLEIDPDHAPCLSLRSIALERSGQTNIAVDSARDSLSRNPDDSYAHSTHAWALLSDGKHKEAQESFREALRLDPTNEFAKQGMINALNANNFIFRMVLKWYTAMGRLSGGIQWAIILGLFFGSRVLSSLSENIPLLKPFIIPLIFLYVAFCVTTWIANPLFNTFLRFNRYGKYLLDKDQIRSSNAMAAVMGLGLVLGIGLAIVLVEEELTGLVIGLAFGVIMLIPLSVLFQCEKGYPFNIMLGVTLFLGFVGLSGIALLFAGYMPPNIIIMTFIYGNIGAQFLGNYLVSVNQKI